MQAKRSTGKKGKKKATKRASSSHKHLPAIFSRLPRWSLLFGAVLIVAAYVWVFYYFFVSPTGFRWRGLYGDAKYPSGFEIQGIDVSHYQGTIDWEQLRHAMISGCPLRFIMIKATEGTTELDKHFAVNFYQAR